MSELIGPVGEMIQSTGEVAVQFVVDKGAMEESRGRFTVVHENTATIERLLNQIGLNMLAIDQALAAENDHGESTATAEIEHTNILEGILTQAQVVLADSGNEHADNALTSLRDAANEAGSAGVAYKQALDKTEQLLKYAENVRRGIAMIATGTELIRERSQEASVLSNTAATDVEAAADHSANAKNELELYQTDIE